MEGTKIAKRFEGKVAIVTASTQGIGFTIAERLGLEGASVVISSRKQKNVDEAVEKLKSRIEVLGVVCHLSNAQQRKNLIDKTIQDAGPHMSKGSSVVIISSIAGYHPPASMAMYGVTKTALLGLTKALAAEMAPNTRVNCVAPGFVPTHFASFITENDALRKEVEGRTMLNRLGTTQDMAAATAFLASDDASYITGETLVVAGGTPSRL
ncbi:tropinone reductase-like 3 isoform X2 [Quercus robur]|uniref:tropinone reductase-like 3 isoform X2 n=1 Tax=Quercus robur TaxID=38942 RepID=UPI002163D46C|nr:tropinone reductase-like 3 isoform X2 [Quercus robur]